MTLLGAGGARYTGTSGSYGVRLLAQALTEVPKTLRARIRPALVASGEGLRQAAAANAEWSTRIPKALKTRTRFSGSRPGVYVVASRKVAPHARTLEGITGNRTFRHPLFGNDEKWVEQPTRPFLAPAVQQQGDEAIRRVGDALDGALRDAGLK